ncbi:hypothetical protein DFH08DRAFT_812984 [Mycena albidolilacea]|uniref:Uncharacterized protein n=1 Tax=Mycena albidolilacea TaxID=1033008 RepID=A0AAD6ZT76_9AGAR|nr:hypothetical protein DFH08DRAFT_812984 [Mycena albidolilacea]
MLHSEGLSNAAYCGSVHERSRQHSGQLVSSLHMFRANPHLASSQHSDIAGLPLDRHQRIREPSPYGDWSVLRRYTLRTQLILTAAHALLARFGPTKNAKKMSTKNRAIGDTEDKFQAALATYTKAGNKTAAMQRLWNAAYGIGGEGAVASMAATIECARRMGFEEGQRSGFEEGRQAGEKDALSMDAFEVSFAAGKMSGIAMGMELGRETETQRWTDSGHFEGGTCRAFGNAAVVDSLPPPQSLPLDNDAYTFLVHTGFSWTDDAESLPIHSVLVVSPQPRDFSNLRTGSRNAFNTLQWWHARYHGAQTQSRRLQRLRVHSSATTNQHGLPHLTRPRLDLAPQSKPSGDERFSILELLAWVWTPQ